MNEDTVRIDKRGLICVNPKRTPGDEYRIHIAADGVIVLTPMHLLTLPEHLDIDITNPLLPAGQEYPYGEIPKDYFAGTPNQNLSAHLQQFKWEQTQGHPNNVYPPDQKL